eukprot:COSAG01_NODE_31942_length_589_cov_0.385714_1_plen_90_part_00
MQATADEAVAALQQQREDAKSHVPRQLDRALDMDLGVLATGVNQVGDGKPWMGSPTTTVRLTSMCRVARNADRLLAIRDRDYRYYHPDD